MSEIPNFIGGAIVFGYCLIALFFCKFWRHTRDSFFMWFALAFFVLGIGRIIESYYRINEQASMPAVYLFRLTAFSIIIIAILQKNLSDKN